MSRAFKKRARKAASKLANVITVAICAVLLLCSIYAYNNVTFSKEYILENDNIPKTFVGYKIAHISDIANDINTTESTIDNAYPDIVIITGNFTDKTGNFDTSVRLVKELSSRYTVLYTLGAMDSAVQSELNRELEGVGAINIEKQQFPIVSDNIKYEEFVAEFIEDTYLEQATNPESEAAAYLEYTKYALEEDKEKQIIITGLPCMSADTNFIDIGYESVSLDKEVFQILAFNQSEFIDELAKIDIHAMLTGNILNGRNSAGYAGGVYYVNGKTSFVNSGVNRDDAGTFKLSTVNIITLSDGTINTNNTLENFIAKFSSEAGNRFEKDHGFYTYTAYKGIENTKEETVNE